jgi:hypothetical protein
MKRKSPEGSIPKDIKSAHEAIKRYYTNAAKASQEEIKKTNTDLQGFASHNGDNRDHLKQRHNTHRRKAKVIQWALATYDPLENIAIPSGNQSRKITKGTPKPNGQA